MNEFYDEVASHFYGVNPGQMIDAIEASCITRAEWAEDQDACLSRVQGALEEMVNFDFEDYGPTEYQEWADFDPDC